MRTSLIVLGTLVGLALGWAGASAQQEVRPTPGPGSGTITVRGTVDIGNTPHVMAMQSGDWRVTVANPPPDVTTAPDFVTPRVRYTIVWPAGDRETVTLAALSPNGWAQVDSPASQSARRWINLGVAVSIEEAP